MAELPDRNKVAQAGCRTFRNESIVQKAAFVEAPCGSVMEIKVTVRAILFTRKVIPIGFWDKPHELCVRQFIKFFRRDRLTDTQSFRFHFHPYLRRLHVPFNNWQRRCR